MSQLSAADMTNQFVILFPIQITSKTQQGALVISGAIRADETFQSFAVFTLELILYVLHVNFTS
jgi:hypothetical protein